MVKFSNHPIALGSGLALIKVAYLSAKLESEYASCFRHSVSYDKACVAEWAVQLSEASHRHNSIILAMIGKHLV